LRPLLTRHAIQVLASAGHIHVEVAARTSGSERTVRRVLEEGAATHIGDAIERQSRSIGRPSKAEPFHALVRPIFVEKPGLPPA
jgi:hypothetical protein